MNKTLLIILLIAWFALIWILSSLPAEHLPKFDTINVDKFSHIFVYSILSILIFLSYKKGSFGTLSKQEIFLIALLMAALDESHQVLITNRFVSLWDFSANVSGLLIGYFLTREKYRTA